MSNRRATPPNRGSAAAAASTGTPISRAIATAPVALTTLWIATQRQPDRRQLLAPTHHRELERAAHRAHVDGAHVRVVGQAVGDRGVAVGQLPRARIVGAQHLRTGDLGEIPVEPGHDPLEGAVVVEVVDVDVGDDGAVEREFEVRPVALVGLDHEPLAPGPLRAGAHVGHVAPDDEARGAGPPRRG
jgi:hypothetical protein